jgi:ribosomal protein L37AE/L43A
MADYITTGYKTCRCKACGHSNTQLFQTTIFKCNHCGANCFSAFHGTVIDINGNRIY